MLLWVLKCACGAPARSIVKDDGRDGVLEVEQQRADVYLEGNVFCGGGFCLNDPALPPEKKAGRLHRTYEELIKHPYGAYELMAFAAGCKTWVSVEVQDLLSFARLDWSTRQRIADEIRRELHATDDLFAPLYVVDAENLLARLARDRLRLQRAEGPYGTGRRRRRVGTFTLRKPATPLAPGIRSSGDLADLQHRQRCARIGRRAKQQRSTARPAAKQAKTKRKQTSTVAAKAKPRGCKNLFFSDLAGVRAHKNEAGQLFVYDD